MAETYAAIDWYEQALFYDMIFDTETSVEADFLETIWSRHGTIPVRRVLEPACGSGRLVAEMARRGHDVTGYDISPGMLRFARDRLEGAGLAAELRAGRMESFTSRRRFDAAHCLVSTFKYLLDEASARAHLASTAKLVRPGGVYVVGLHLTDYDDRSCNRERWIAERDGVRVVCNIQGWPADRRCRLERVRSRMVVRRDGATKVERYESNWNFRTYSLRQLGSLLRQASAWAHVATYDFEHDADAPRELDGSQLDVVLVLRRR